MKRITCDICGNGEVPLNDSIKIDGQAHCVPCIDQLYPERSVLQHRHIERESDSTVCAFCDNDFNEDLGKISVHFVCPDCKKAINNRAFPGWVKAFFAGILLLVVFSFWWNWRYYTGYSKLNSAFASFENRDYTLAREEMTVASENVPEVEDLRTLTAYFKGMEFLAAGKCTEALIEFNKCKDKVPYEYNIEYLSDQAAIGSTFDKKDYKGFLQSSEAVLKYDTINPTAILSVASAHACLYASGNDESEKQQAYAFLQRAKAIDSTDTDIREYSNMIEYRIASKNIISREEFLKKFPNGWSKN